MTKALSSMVVIMISIGVITPVVYTAESNTTESPEGWSEDIRLTEFDRNDSFVRMDTWGDNIHLVWRRSVGGDASLRTYYMRSADSGISWSEPIQLSPDGVSARSSDVAVYEDNVYVVWHHWVGQYEVFYRRSEDGGDTWLPEQMISSDDGYNSEGPKIAVGDDGMSIHVVWIDERHGDVGGGSEADRCSTCIGRTEYSSSG